MDDWEKFHDTLMQISCTQKEFKVFLKKSISQYHDLYAESDVLLLPTIASFFSAPRLACQAALKEAK